MDVALSAIEMDHSIQCRASIVPATVNDYAERMTAGDRLPPVDLFESGGRYWIGDGWHRIASARQIGALSIDANVREGGRRDALKFALGANSSHGLRRTNEDKRRCVEIALTEFAEMSNRAIAEMCGVDDKTVSACRTVTCGISAPERTGADGKQYPAKRKAIVNDETAPVVARNTSRDEKAGAVKSLISTGHNPEQISDSLGISVPNVRSIIREFDLSELPRKGRGAAKINADHVIEETVNAIAATTHGLRLIRAADFTISKHDASALLSELRVSMKSLQWLVNKLKELSA